jgi:DNA-binding transcriptional LysR family regulator
MVLESNVPPELTSLRWKKVGTVVVTPKGHPLVKSKRLTLKQIAKYPLILPPKNLKYTYRSRLEERFQELGIDFQIIMESSNVELSTEYVEMGLGISFATIVVDLPQLKQRKLEFLPVDHLFKPDHIAVVVRKDKALVSYKSAFIQILFGESDLAMVRKNNHKIKKTAKVFNNNADIMKKSVEGQTFRKDGTQNLRSKSV